MPTLARAAEHVRRPLALDRVVGGADHLESEAWRSRSSSRLAASTNRSLPLRVETTATVPTVNGRGSVADRRASTGIGVASWTIRGLCAAPGEPRRARRRRRRPGRGASTRRGAACGRGGRAAASRGRAAASAALAAGNQRLRQASASNWRARAPAAGLRERRGSGAGSRERRAAAGAARGQPPGAEAVLDRRAARRRRPSRARRGRRRARSACGTQKLNSQPRSPSSGTIRIDRSRRAPEDELVKADDDAPPSARGEARLAPAYANALAPTAPTARLHKSPGERGDLGLRPAQVLRRLRGGRGARPRGRGGRGLRVPRAERRRQDDDDRDPRGLSRRAAPARSRCSARTRRTPSREWRERIGIVLQQCRMRPELTVRETLELYAGYYREPRDVDETIDHVGLGAQGRRPRRQPLRRAAAPPRRRRRADRRPRPALPRRADHRLRPDGAPPGLGRDRGPARPRQDGLPHHALHGRGAAPRRPRGDHRRRARSSPRAGPTSSAAAARGRPRSASACRTASTAGELPGGLDARAERRRAADRRPPTPCEALNRLTGWALRAVGRARRGSRSAAPSLEDIYIELTADGADGTRRMSGARARPAPVPLRPEDVLAQPGARSSSRSRCRWCSCSSSRRSSATTRSSELGGTSRRRPTTSRRSSPWRSSRRRCRASRSGSPPNARTGSSSAAAARRCRPGSSSPGASATRS